MQQVNINRLFIDLILLGNLSWINYAFSSGGIVTDGTLGRAHTFGAPNSIVDVTIKQNDGTTVGHNVFHSFSKFNIASGQTVTFTENKVNSLDNVISRVTGGSRSDINGILRSTPTGHADFYLINPSGVVFGQNAFLDVPAAFHVSTADEMSFKDGGKFSASQPAASRLSAAAPSSFGFLGTSIINNGLIKVNNVNISVKDAQKLDLTSGQILLTSSTFSPGGLQAPGGDIRVAAIRGKGTVDIDKNLPLPNQSPTLRNSGDIILINSFIRTDGQGGGKIALWGNNITLKDSSFVTAVNTGDKDAASNQGEIFARTQASKRLK